MTNIDDQHYINLVLKGDKQAFAVIVDQYKDMVFTLSLKMLKNREEAEEVAQDSFIKLYRSLATFKGESKFSTWLYRVAYNSCLDRLKKQKGEQQMVAVDELIEYPDLASHNMLERMEANERKQIVQNCLNQLPGEDSFLLTLFYFEDQSIKEIAKIMGINDNHVKIKLYRSRKKLSAVLSTHLTPEILKHYESEAG